MDELLGHLSMPLRSRRSSAPGRPWTAILSVFVRPQPRRTSFLAGRRPESIRQRPPAFAPRRGPDGKTRIQDLAQAPREPVQTSQLVGGQHPARRSVLDDQKTQIGVASGLRDRQRQKPCRRLALRRDPDRRVIDPVGIDPNTTSFRLALCRFVQLCFAWCCLVWRRGDDIGELA
ncbi:hypothetical protein [Rhodovulum sulfidophilum]|uniref:hypothetical protein n=1 Tax=Rhodovulum sulfidophilum TaxID=35806 RepID=UPI0013894214|nr:hypothetical protein [Rhodovulum sulfidophilum]